MKRLFAPAVRKLARLVVFLAILGALLYLLSDVFTPKRVAGQYRDSYTVGGFYSEPRGQIDVLFLGTSHIEVGVSPLTIWHEQGITSYSLATPVQSPLISYYFLQEALKYQPIRVVVIEANALYREQNIDVWEDAYRRAFDFMPPSLVKLRAALDIASYSEKQSALSYMLPLLRYHDRWPALGEAQFQLNLTPEHNLKGIELSWRRVDTSTLLYDRSSARLRAPLQPFGEDYMNRIAALCQERGIALVLMQPPYGAWSDAKHQYVQTWAKRWDASLIDYNTVENLAATQFDTATDFYDDQHINTYGAEKISTHLGRYLAEQFSLTDHRSDPVYAAWEKDYAYYALIRSGYLLLPDSERLQYQRFVEPALVDPSGVIEE